MAGKLKTTHNFEKHNKEVKLPALAQHSDSINSEQIAKIFPILKHLFFIHQG